MANGYKTGGRVKGTPNKRTSLIKAFCTYILEDGYDRFKAEFNKLEGKDYVDAFIAMSKLTTSDTEKYYANKYLTEIINEHSKKIQDGTN